MASYRIEWKQSAKKEIRKLDKTVIPKILEAVAALAQDPRPRSSKKLRGTDHTYRIRIGDYRIVYSVFPNVLTIEIVKVGHRKDIYR
ncbi:MAG: type II toxin-antitoxin system RelE/ParE family toxin [Halothece sp. Uz-M2-17]|nr:type II toxin-antitoxin system RelE/ParE family toxin [Halothece sp. Uz-M2-17]